jgi:chorismate mutase
MTKVRGIRGATTANSNSRDAILSATKELLDRLIEANDIDPDDVAAAIFTTTPDLNAEFPAAAARLMGWTYVALMGASEVYVSDAPPMCIRVLILTNTEKSAKELQNVYLKGAANLRSRGLQGV